MHFSSVFYVYVALAGLLVQASPIAQNNAVLNERTDSINARELLSNVLMPRRKGGSGAKKPPPPKIAKTTAARATTSARPSPPARATSSPPPPPPTTSTLATSSTPPAISSISTDLVPRPSSPATSSAAVSSAKSSAAASSATSPAVVSSANSSAVVSSATTSVASTATSACACASTVTVTVQSAPAISADPTIQYIPTSAIGATAAAGSGASPSAAPSLTEPLQSVPLCSAYSSPDAQDISQRDLELIGKRAGEEFWFRWEDKNVAKSGSILQLATRKGGKNFDDQAYKWISTNAAKITRSSLAGRVPAVYVLPAGTAKTMLAQAKDFAVTSAAKTPADFVTKDNEPGDIGINGVAKSSGGSAIPLDTFRAKVIRTVIKTATTGSQQYTTIKGGKASKTATKSDKAILDKISC